MTRKPDELIQLKLRFREDLRARTESAAEQNGNSLNAEIVSRLRQSFEIEEEFGGPTGLRMFRSMAVALFMTEQRQGDWRTNRYAFEAAKAAIARVMDEFAPGYPDDVVEIAELDEQATNLKAQIDKLKVDLEARRPRKPLPPGTGMFGRMLGGFNQLYDSTMGEVALDVDLITQEIAGEDAELFRKYHAMRREYDPLKQEVERRWREFFDKQQSISDDVTNFVSQSIERARTA